MTALKTAALLVEQQSEIAVIERGLRRPKKAIKVLIEKGLMRSTRDFHKRFTGVRSGSALQDATVPDYLLHLSDELIRTTTTI